MNKAFLRAVIVCGGPIKDYQRLKNSLREDDFFVFCDGGLYHQKELGFEPNLIVGDFDSYTQKTTEGLESDFPEAKIIKLPREKDDTDSIYASKYVYEAGFKNILTTGTVLTTITDMYHTCMVCFPVTRYHHTAHRNYSMLPRRH